MNTQRSILAILLIIIIGVCLTSCGGGSEAPEPPLPQGDLGKEDMGKIPQFEGEPDYNDSTSVLNIQGIYKEGAEFNLELLKLCSDTRCWTALDKNNAVSSSSNKRYKTELVTEGVHTVDIGSFNIYNFADYADKITSLEYIYNTKPGKITLEEPIKPHILILSALYLRLDNGILTAKTSLVKSGTGGRGLFVPGIDFVKDFPSGAIIQIPKGAADKAGNIWVYKMGEHQTEHFRVPTYLFKFYSYKTDSEIITYDESGNIDFENAYPESKFHKYFLKEIDVYLPVHFTTASRRTQLIEKLKSDYVISDGRTRKDFNIIAKEEQNYIHFKTHETTFTVTLLLRQPYDMEVN